MNTTAAASDPSDAPLASTRIGEGPRRVAFLHGLMGRGRNFTGPAKELGDDFTVELIDLPDHGASPWTDRVDYREIADRVAAHLRGGLAADGSLFFETTALTDLGADGVYGGSGMNADTLVSAGGAKRVRGPS